MSNLGAYQWITRTSKKVGGPINLLLLTATLGATVYKLSEVGVKKCIKTIKSHPTTKNKHLEDKSKIYSVTSCGTSNEGIFFSVGEQYKVLESVEDAVLIEKGNDTNNPFFVSAEFLRTISDFSE